MHLCRDCRHVGRKSDTEERYQCRNPAAAETLPNYYDGISRVAYPSIEVARMIGACGVEGKLWEERTNEV